MKISINQTLSELSEDFHKGDLSLTDYRIERRKALEALNSNLEVQSTRARSSSKGLIKRVFYGTCCVVLLIFTTVIVAKLLM